MPNDPFFWSWLAGFIDGEGSFKVAIKKADKNAIGFEVMPQVDITQSIVKRKEVEELSHKLKHSIVVEHNSTVGNTVCRINIYRRADIRTVLQGVYSYLRFKKHEADLLITILNRMDEGKHLTINGFLEIAKLREGLSYRTKPKNYRSYISLKEYFNRRKQNC